MIIAQKLVKENIAEYVLYMWNVEDIIRAFNLDLEQINNQLIASYQVSDTERIHIKEWYESLIEMMRAENVAEKGHIQLIKNVIIDIDDMHRFLLSSTIDAAYNAKFYYILPALTMLKSKTLNPNISDIEMCFVFLYGIMNLRRKKQTISEDTEKTATEVGKFMILLTANYKKWKNNEFDR